MEKFKKIIGVGIMLLCMHTSYSQSRLGYSQSEIYEEFKGDKGFVSGYPQERWLSVEVSTALVFFTFNENNVCDVAIISPYTTSDLNYYINRYNAEYKKTSEGHWVIVAEGYNIYISLQQTEDGVYFFNWTF